MSSGSKNATTIYRYSFQAYQAGLLAWFEQKKTADVPIGQKYPDVLRTFVLRDSTTDPIVTETAFSVLQAYSALTKVPKLTV
jgi:hypothetical protein